MTSNPNSLTLRPSADKRAIVLLSGGLDSATTLAMAREAGFELHALSFDYGQRHRVELDAARQVAQQIGVASHRWVRIDLRAFGHSALTDDIAVPKDQPQAALGQEHGAIPVTYVPARNTIFLSYALALAEVVHSSDVFIGVNAVDYSGYPDCRRRYIEAFEAMANLATRAGVEAAAAGRPGLTIHTPLIDWPKTKIIQRGLELGVDYRLTHSCYDPAPDGQACGHCDACLLRRRAFEHLGLSDPVLDDDGKPGGSDPR